MRLFRWFRRAPDRHIGGRDNPYLLRWHLVPRNRWFNIYLHKFLRDDEDIALHDHPWWSVSVLIRGRYTEWTQRGQACRVYRAPRIRVRSATFAHRISLTPGETAWTIFVTGPTVREWGFHCPKGWRHWRDFVNPSDHGEIGRGCD